MSRKQSRKANSKVRAKGSRSSQSLNESVTDTSLEMTANVAEAQVNVSETPKVAEVSAPEVVESPEISQEVEQPTEQEAQQPEKNQVTETAAAEATTPAGQSRGVVIVDSDDGRTPAVFQMSEAEKLKRVESTKFTPEELLNNFKSPVPPPLCDSDEFLRAMNEKPSSKTFNALESEEQKVPSMESAIPEIESKLEECDNSKQKDVAEDASAPKTEQKPEVPTSACMQGQTDEMCEGMESGTPKSSNTPSAPRRSVSTATLGEMSREELRESPEWKSAYKMFMKETGDYSGPTSTSWDRPAVPLEESEFYNKKFDYINFGNGVVEDHTAEADAQRREQELKTASWPGARVKINLTKMEQDNEYPLQDPVEVDRSVIDGGATARDDDVARSPPQSLTHINGKLDDITPSAYEEAIHMSWALYFQEKERTHRARVRGESNFKLLNAARTFLWGVFGGAQNPLMERSVVYKVSDGLLPVHTDRSTKTLEFERQILLERSQGLPAGPFDFRAARPQQISWWKPPKHTDRSKVPQSFAEMRIANALNMQYYRHWARCNTGSGRMRR